MATIWTNTSIPETLADLRLLFRRYDIEDWELMTGESDRSYLVQVTQSLFLWAWRVGGVREGVTFIHGGLVTTGARQPGDRVAEECATRLDGRGDQCLPRKGQVRPPRRHPGPGGAESQGGPDIAPEHGLRSNPEGPAGEEVYAAHPT